MDLYCESTESVFQTHSNTNRQPQHSLNVEELQAAVKYILSNAEKNAILLPGRIPGYKKYNVQLLPSSCTKKGVWQLYESATEKVDGKRVVRQSTLINPLRLNIGTCTIYLNAARLYLVTGVKKNYPDHSSSLLLFYVSIIIISQN